MSAIFRQCVGCNIRYASIDEDLCEDCFNDYQVYTEYDIMKDAKGNKGRVPMPPPSKVMEDSRTKRQRSRSTSGQADFDEICLTCNGLRRVNGQICPDCDGSGLEE